ncbi:MULTISPECIES: LacI family DNA-binding transcriptional regulator [Hymenobacter]|uniref:Substrate-binding domain-containing protein n=1 Tax=Hymenobacter jejuensis TaxID=2502781 RepID=A0A5B8A0Q0_9BACT|nr:MULTISPECIES: substrate-binding domain-containing protein [Hymenobacter]MBC6992382.1 substrate-binding domain-containing protein [Hymenobacter sp. BT491]QDA60273.1 substrate-binding domain-containing protein [Hymenobacter jejuensis]
MIKCVKCGLADDVMRAGFIRGRQRFFCKACDYHFTEEKTERTTERKRHQTTIGDVAKAVGVASSTVSRALNGHSDISPNTRQVILDVARQLDYQPNLLAQSLKSSETYTIGVLIPDIERPFFATAVSGIQQVAAESGYRVMICQSKESYQMEVSNVQALVASRVDGLLICHSRETENFDHVRPEACRGIPVVHFDRVCNELNSAKVILDDWDGAFAVTEHLIQEGCRRIAVLAGPESLLISRQRIAGYRSALQKYGLPIRDEWRIHINFRTESAVAALDTWLSLPEPPDAIFAINYTNAFDLIQALKQRHIRIPDEIAVVGFGDEFLAGMIEPGLTTVNLHPYRIGQQAARLFLEQVRMKEDFQPRTFVISGDLVIRQSSLKGKGSQFTLTI